jgi:hypothetical protein
VAAISIQDNTNVARQRSSFDLAQESTLVNPVEKSQQLRGPISSAKGPLLHSRVVDIDQGGTSWWSRASRAAPDLDDDATGLLPKRQSSGLSWAGPKYQCQRGSRNVALSSNAASGKAGSCGALRHLRRLQQPIKVTPQSLQDFLALPDPIADLGRTIFAASVV